MKEKLIADKYINNLGDILLPSTEPILLNLGLRDNDEKFSYFSGQK
jgi:hypothetical protein